MAVLRTWRIVPIWLVKNVSQNLKFQWWIIWFKFLFAVEPGHIWQSFLFYLIFSECDVCQVCVWWYKTNEEYATLIITMKSSSTFYSTLKQRENKESTWKMTQMMDGWQLKQREWPSPDCLKEQIKSQHCRHHCGLWQWHQPFCSW